MTRALLLLGLLSAIASVPTLAAEKDTKKSKGGSKAERTADNVTKKARNIADTATKAVGRGVDKTEKGIKSIGNKTGKWIKEKID